MKNTADKLRVIYGDCSLGLKGKSFHYIFSYSKGAPESFRKNGKEWIYRSPVPAFWRAVTDNDRRNGFTYLSSVWAGADLYRKCVRCEVRIDGEAVEGPGAPFNNRYSNEEFAGEAEILYVYETATVPSTLVDVSYRVDPKGKITVHFYYHGKQGLPQLPLVGLRFIMPTPASGYEYCGLSGETYPDRMAGGIPGVYQVDGLPVTPYIVPQDCQMHMDTRWLRITRNTTLNNADVDADSFSLCFDGGDAPFAFSCLPYTAQQLESAEHQEELPAPRRTVLLMLAKVRGVGGIDSWGSDVEERYHVSAEEDHEMTFTIS